MASVLRAMFQWRMLVVMLLGFSSGLPLLLIGGTLKAWLRQEHIDLATIGFFSLAGLPYALKFLWAPIMDRFVPPWLGRRRGWLALCQVALALGFIAIGVSDPGASLYSVATLAVIVGFFSASQDIVVDAYRREILKEEELGFGMALGINGYRAAMWVASALALVLAGIFSWAITYFVMASLMAFAIVVTLVAPEPDTGVRPPATLKEAAVGPFAEFFTREGFGKALVILSFIVLYKIGDSMANEMLNPFYIDLGFSLEMIGGIGKTVGLTGTFGGALLGGIIILKLGIHRSLWLFGAFQAISTACFVLLAMAGNSVWLLALVVAFETLSGGMGTAAYAGYMASLTNKRFTATQYALLSSLMGVPRVVFGAATGLIAEQLGWTGFFVFCTLIAAPGMALLPWIAPWNGEPVAEPARAT
jgi:MFS transporter, PAT family, beta-lactamase induction signal transducer AmpG